MIGTTVNEINNDKTKVYTGWVYFYNNDFEIYKNIFET